MANKENDSYFLKFDKEFFLRKIKEKNKKYIIIPKVSYKEIRNRMPGKNIIGKRNRSGKARYYRYSNNNIKFLNNNNNNNNNNSYSNSSFINTRRSNSNSNSNSSNNNDNDSDFVGYFSDNEINNNNKNHNNIINNNNKNTDKNNNNKKATPVGYSFNSKVSNINLINNNNSYYNSYTVIISYQL